MKTVSASAFFLLALCGSVAQASPLDLYGGSPAGLAHNGALTAWAEDGSAAFFNPAGLGLGGAEGHTQIHLSYMQSSPMLFIQRAGPSVATNPSASTESGGMIVGSLLVPIGSKFADKVSIGITFAVPIAGLLNEESLEPTKPQWLRYQTGTQRITPAAAIGIHPVKWLSFGAGLQLLSTYSGVDTFVLTVPANGGTNTLGNRDIQFTLNTTIAAIAGITVLPLPNLKLSFAYRQSIGLQINQPDTVTINLLGSPPQPLAIAANGEVLYSPHTFSMGAKYSPTHNLSLGLDVRFERWGVAPPPALFVSVTYNQLFGPPVPTTQPDAHLFHDTWTPTASAEYAFLDGLVTVMGAYTYRPSYAPAPNANESYLDVSAHLVGLGASLHFPDPSHFFPRGIYVDVGGQAQILPRTTVPGSENNPNGIVAYGGTVVTAAAGLHFDY